MTEYRRETNITVGKTADGLDVPVPFRELHDVGLPDSVLKVLEGDGSYALTAVQAHCWPIILCTMRDFVGIVETRLGLPLTYLVPAIVKLKDKPDLAAKDGPIALILAANSEHALQINGQASKFGSLKIKIATLCGVIPEETQTSNLQKGVHILIATPEGLDLMLKSHKTNMKRVIYLVLDNVDFMLNNGFGESIHQLIGQIRRDCQILFWSSTRSEGVNKLAHKYLNDPYKMIIGAPQTNCEQAELVSEERMTQFKKNFYLESQFVAMSKKQVKKYSLANHIVVDGKNVPNPIKGFEDFGFPDHVMDVLTGVDLTSSPTPIEALVWAMALNGRDFIGIGETFPGRTILFLLPAIVHLKHQQHQPGAEDDGPIALILTATPERVVQIQQEAVSKFDVKIACLYGGEVIKGPQILDLQKGSEMVIAMLEGLTYMLYHHHINLNKITYLVLDELDVMFDMGLMDQVVQLLAQIRRDCQLIYWSATDSEDVQNFVDAFLCDPYQVTFLSQYSGANQAIYQKVEIVNEDQKFSKLVQLLRKIMVDRSRILIFIKKENVCDQVQRDLRMNGWPAVTICGNKSQEEREDVFFQFMYCTSRIMITTDDAAASHLGKEINIMHVINYDFPSTLKIYKKRIKRAGAKGKSYTFFTKDDKTFARALVKILKDASQEVSQELEKYVSK